MEFIDIANQNEVESFLTQGYAVVNNISAFPLRLVAFDADLYAGKWAAVKGNDEYVESLVAKGKLSVLRQTTAKPLIDNDSAPKQKKKAKDAAEDSESEQTVPDVAAESLPATNDVKLVDENKDVEVQESPL